MASTPAPADVTVPVSVIVSGLFVALRTNGPVTLVLITAIVGYSLHLIGSRACIPLEFAPEPAAGAKIMM